MKNSLKNLQAELHTLTVKSQSQVKGGTDNTPPPPPPPSPVVVEDINGF